MPMSQFSQELSSVPYESISKSSLTLGLSQFSKVLVKRVEEVEGSQMRAVVEEHHWTGEVVEGRHLVEVVVHQRIVARTS
jgi:hypothetical protein